MASALSFLVALVISLSLVPDSSADFSCDFEQGGWCNYYQDDLDDFDWIRQNGSTATGDTGPDVDHTFGTSLGNYLYVEGSQPRQAKDKARIISFPEDAAKAQCVQFYYFMLGEHMGSIRVYARANTSSTLVDPVFEKTGDQGNRWYRGLATVPSLGIGNSAEIIFEAEIGTGIRSDIAIDDIQVTNTNGKCPLDSFLCNFDSGWCGITQDYTDNFNFIRKKGSTTSFNTGPVSDHTTGKGYYVYIEASGLTNGKKARIITPQFRGVQGNDAETFCVVFWYHMYGTTVGELSVYLRNASSTGLGNPIWWLAGDRGDMWRAAEAEINTPEDFTLYFEAMRGQSFDSDIALDDILITSYGCPGHHIINNVSSVTCDFEEAEICYYTQDKTDNFDWSWRNRGTNDGFTGPDEDHTRGDELGFFIFITGTYRLSSSDKARLISPVIKSNTKTSCVVFWYHMWGRDVETMNIYLKLDKGDLPSNAVWTKSDDQGNYWHRETITIPSNSGDIRIVFEASPGDNNRDDIALDDVVLYEGNDCPTFTTLPPPTTTAPPLVTDIACDFEDDFCGYLQLIQGDQMDWTRESGAGTSAITTTGPQTDHTLGTSKGFYASFDPYVYIGAAIDDKAIIATPLLQASSRARCVQFYAYMYGYSVDYLNLYMRPWGSTRTFDPQFSEYGNHGIGWFKLQMNIPPSTENFQILFEAVCGRSRYSAEIALDDITLKEGLCDSIATPTPVNWEADCDFEQDGTLCGYTQYPYNNFDWIRHSGRTGSEGTGPQFDHTLGSEKGHYMYIESSIPQRPNYRAILLSPTLNSRNNDLCMRFYYHAYGDDTGLLVVKLNMLNFGTTTIFGITGDQGDAWTPANVNLPSTLVGGANFQIQFEGRTGSGFLGDIAIDDIKFLQQPCAGFPSESQCSFEQGLDYCGFMSDTTADFNWMWYDALALEDSPLNIVSTSFAYAAGSSKTRNKKSVLLSETYNLLGMAHCLTADFVIDDDDSQQLKIEVLEHSTAKRYNLATLSGDMGKDFFRGNWSLDPDVIKQPFQIVFTATMGSRGIMVVDNVIVSSQLYSCAQYIPPPTMPPTTTATPTAAKRTSTTVGPTTITPTKPAPPTTQGAVGSVKPHTGPTTGAIAGIAVAVIVIVIVVVLGVVMWKARPCGSGTLGFSYKKDDIDEIPFSGIKAGNVGSGAFANPTVTVNAPGGQGSTA